MFVFRWFNIFDDPYRNGFADGFTIGFGFWILMAVVRVYIVWDDRAEKLRSDILNMIRGIQRGEKVGQKEADDFRAMISGSDLIEIPDKMRILDFCDAIILFSRTPSNHKLNAVEELIPGMEKWIQTAEFSLFRAFLRHPGRNFLMTAKMFFCK